MCVKGAEFSPIGVKKEKAAAFTAAFRYLAFCVIVYLMRTFWVAEIPAPLTRMMY